jgi:hypothetical protein
VSRTPSAIGDLAGILGGPVVSSTPPEPASATPSRSRKPRVSAAPPLPPVVAPSGASALEATPQPKLLEDPDERSDRITAILPIALLARVEMRVASLRRKKKVSMSGYIEAALLELLAMGDRDLEALERHKIKARRTLSRLR